MPDTTPLSPSADRQQRAHVERMSLARLTLPPGVSDAVAAIFESAQGISAALDQLPEDLTPEDRSALEVVRGLLRACADDYR